MANTKSARKRIRTNARNRARNRSERTALRNEIKKFRAALGSGDAEAAKSLLPEVHSALDRGAKKGIIPSRTAGRTKARLALAQQKLVAPSAG